MARCRWLVLLLLIPALCGFDTRGPFRTRGPFKAYDFSVGGTLLGAEQRCSDLGANCSCSETLDGTYSFPVGSEESANFPDSPAATECSPFEMEPVADPGDFAAVEPPVALNGFTRVMAIQPGPYGWLTSGPPSATAKRWCGRYYFMVTNDYSGQGNLASCPIQRNKLTQVTLGARTPQIQERSDSDSCTGPGFGAYREFWLDTQISGTILSPSVRFSDCNVSSGWCRVEMCVGSSTTLVSSGTKTIEAYIKKLSTGVESSASVTETHFGASGTYWGADLYHGGGNGAGAGIRYVGPFMAAEWTTNAGQRIGAAVEVGE